MFLHSDHWRNWLIMWFALMALIYRLSRSAIGVAGHCPCLGNVAEWWPWLSKHQDGLSLFLMLFLVLGSGVAFAFLRVPEGLKMPGNWDKSCAR